MDRDKIKSGVRYVTKDGGIWLVDFVEGQKIVATEMGYRLVPLKLPIEISLGRFASRVEKEHQS